MSKFCLQCDDDTKLKLQTKDVTVEARGESCVVPKVTGWHCPVCGDIEFTDNYWRYFGYLIAVITFLVWSLVSVIPVFSAANCFFLIKATAPLVK